MTSTHLSFKGMSEKAFAQEFEIMAHRMNCMYVDIPDAIMTQDRLENAKRRIRERKRPADGILVTPCGLSLIELKVGYNTAMPHQKRFSWLSRVVNKSAYFFVKRIDKAGSPQRYLLLELDDVDKGWVTTLETGDLAQIIIKIAEIQKGVKK